MGLQCEADYQDPEHEEVATPAEPLEHRNWCHILTLCYWRHLMVQTLFFPLCSWHTTISHGQCPTLRILLLQFVPQGNFMDPCYLQTNMAFDEFPTKKKILNSGIIQNTRNLAPQEQWLTVLRLPYCLEEETWHEWIPETHPCLVAWSIMIQLHHFPCSCNFSLLRCGSEAGRTTQAPLFQHFSVVCWVAFSWQQHLARGSVGLSVDVCWGTVDSQLVLF